MEDIVYGCLATSNTTFKVQLAPLDGGGLLSSPDRRCLQGNFKYRFFPADSTSRYELYLVGTIAGPHYEALTCYLERFGVPLTAIFAFRNLIYDKYMPGDDVEALAWIDVYGYEPIDREVLDDDVFNFDYDDDDNDESDRVDWEEEEFGRPTPASRDAVEALERVVMFSPVEESTCGVCLEEFVLESEATKMPCSHAFHGDCIVRWLENSCFCPLCRFELPSDS